MRRRRVVLLSVAFVTFLPGQALLGDPPKPPAPARTDQYGDPLPKGARFRLGTVRLRHTNRVTAVGWMSDGRTLASAGEDWEVRLWQIPSGKQNAKWEHARKVVLSPDGRTLAYTGIPDDAVYCIDVVSGKELRKIRLANGDCSAALSPDGKILATVEGKSACLYAVKSGKKLCCLEGKLRTRNPYLVFSPDGRDLVGMTEKGICCWNTRAGAKHFPPNNDCCDPFALSPDGKLLAAVQNGISGIITLRSWLAGKEFRKLEIKDGAIWALAFSPDGKMLATSESGSIGLWDLSTGRELHRCKEQWESRRLAFSPDCSLLASASLDGAVNVWELPSGKAPRLLPVARHRLELLGLASDGQTLLTRSSDDVLTVWNARDGHRLRILKNGEESVDNFLFGSDAGRMRAMLRQEVESGRYEPAFSIATISDLAFSADYTSLAVNNHNENGILVVHKTAQGIESCYLDDHEFVEQARKRGIPFDVQKPTFSPDGRFLAAAYSNDRLILWDWHRKLPIRSCSLVLRRLLSGHQAFLPDGRLLAITDGSSIDLVEVASGKVSRQFHPEQLSITSLTFAPDSRTLAVGVTSENQALGVNESDIQLWDLLTVKQSHVLRGHKGVIRSLAFSPDGASLYSGSDDQTVLCWDVAALLRCRISSKELSASRLTDLWTDLASNDAERGQRAVAELIQAPDAALPFLKRSLRPIARVDTIPIATLIADLDHAEFARREKASAELEKIGTPAAPALRKALSEKPTLEMHRRSEALLEAIDVLPLTDEELRTTRAVQVLETVATAEARRILERSAHSPAGAMLTHEARSALQRLVRRRTSP